MNVHLWPILEDIRVYLYLDIAVTGGHVSSLITLCLTEVNTRTLPRTLLSESSLSQPNFYLQRTLISNTFFNKMGNKDPTPKNTCVQ